MIRASYLEDGYSRPGYIRPVPLMHAGLRFTYRPALVEERSQLNDAARQLASHLYDRQAAAFLAEKLVDWNLTDSRGEPISIASHALLRLHPDLFVRLNRIVLGWVASDDDPDWSQETRNRASDEEMAATLAGGTVGEAARGARRKKLVMGVNLALFHPQILLRSCASCRIWMYDDQHRIATWAGKPLPRPASSPTPCWKCPKRSPAHAAGYERDIGRIERTLEVYFQFRASAGSALPDGRAADPLLCRHLAIIDVIVRRWERLRAHAKSAPMTQLAACSATR